MQKRLPLIIAAAVLGILAVFMANSYLKEKERKIAAGARAFGESYYILVATRDILEDVTISKDMVEPVSIPSQFIQPYAVSSLEQVVGKITAVPIARGEQVMTTKLVTEKRGTQSLSVRTPSGKRAITISVDPISGVGGLITPGDRVDVLGTFNVPFAGGNQIITATLVQNALIMAVDQEIVGQEKKSRKDKRPATENISVTLALTPQEAEIVLFSKEQGKLQLSVRSKADEETVALPPMSIQGLASLLFPEMLQQPMQKESPKVEIFRGLEKEVVTVKPSEK